MKLTGKTRQLCNRDIMITNITQLAEIAFQGEGPEMEWNFFRNELKKKNKKK